MPEIQVFFKDITYKLMTNIIYSVIIFHINDLEEAICL